MNDLTLSAGMAQAFPSLVQGLRKAQSILDSIKSFEDIERVFLLGAGLSPNTYRSYLEAVKQFYRFTEGKHPLQVTAGDIEAFYDDLVHRVDLSTAYLRVMGLKRFFAGIRAVLPIYTSPFETMTEKLTHKLNRTRRKHRTKAALTRSEADALIQWLRLDISPIGQENLALVTILLTSGLRASELCSLRWAAVQRGEGWYCTFTAKGGETQEQPLVDAAVMLARESCRARLGRELQPEDALFWTLPAFRGDPPRPIAYHALWTRIGAIGKAARAAGILKRELQFTPHLFRRSFATLLVKGGMNAKAVQILTRHASIETLFQHYIDSEERPDPYFAELLQVTA